MHEEIWNALENAIVLAVRSHQGQRDKAGEPYILHLFRVMNSVGDPVAKQAAVLHDFMEDVEGTVGELHRQRISPAAIEAIMLLTHAPEISYCSYIIALSRDTIACQVKQADLEDNYRIGRVAYRAGHEREDAKRMQRYALSHQFLSGGIDEKEYRNRMRGLE